LVTPTPGEEVVTVPASIILILETAVEMAIAAGAAAARQAVTWMQANRTQIVDLLCGATAGDIDLKLDDVINAITDAIADATAKQAIEDLLQYFLKQNVIKQVLL
jgi:hypothetical protein